MTRLIFFALLPSLLLACGDEAEGTSPDDTNGGEDCVPTDEVCDGEDNDCDGEIDEDATDAVTFYLDADGDGYGDDASTEQACELVSGLSDVGGDCDDDDATAYPDAFERCDGVDNDCDGSVDGISVPADHATIQEAVDAAAAGDLICLDPGTYPEQVLIESKAVRLGGAGPEEVRIRPASAFAVASEGERSMYSLAIVEADGTEVFGMSLGEIQVIDTDGVLLEDIVIDEANCTGSDCKGGALYLDGSTVDLVDLSVVDNELSVANAGTLQLEGLVFARSSDLSWSGGGFLGNTLTLEASKVLTYGLVYLYQSTWTATDMVIEGNTLTATASSDSSSQPGNAYQAGLVYAVETELDLSEVWMRDNVFQSSASNSAGGTANAITYVGITLEGGSLSWAGGGLVDGFANSVGGSKGDVGLGYTWGDSAELSGVDIHDNDLYGLANDSSGRATCWGLYFAGTPATLSQVDLRANQSVCEGGDSSGNLGQLVHSGGTTVYENVVLTGNYNATSGTLMGQLTLSGQSSTPELTNVTLHHNTSYGARAKSGAIVADENGIRLLNVVVTDNRVGVSSDDADHTGASALHVEGSTDVSIAYSNFNGNSTGAGTHIYVDGSEIEDSVIGSEGNLDVAPGYVDVAGTDPEAWDLHLATDSALIDAGDPGISDTDASTSDMGAYGGPSGAW